MIPKPDTTVPMAGDTQPMPEKTKPLPKKTRPKPVLIPHEIDIVGYVEEEITVGYKEERIFGFDLRSFGLMLGIASLVLSALFALMIVFIMIYLGTKPFSFNKALFILGSYTRYWHTVDFVEPLLLVLLMMTVSIMLIVGVLQNRPIFLMIYIICGTITELLIFYVIGFAYKIDEFSKPVYTLIMGFCVVYTFMLLMLYSLYRTMSGLE